MMRDHRALRDLAARRAGRRPARLGLAALGAALVAVGGGAGCSDGAQSGLATCVERCEVAVSCRSGHEDGPARCAELCAHDPEFATRDADACGAGASCGCVRTPSVSLGGAVVLGAHPGVRLEDGSWARQCEPGASDGLVFEVALLATDEPSDAAGVGVNAGIRPGDVVDFAIVDGPSETHARVSGTGALGLRLDCVDALPSQATSCPATAAPVGEAERVDFAAHTAGHDAPLALVLIVDLSGSISGLVDVDAGALEGRPGTFLFPPDFSNHASDPNGSRLTAAGELIASLGPEDDLCVLGFSEQRPGGVVVPSVDATGDPDRDIAACFDGGDRARWKEEDGRFLDSLIGQAAGRAPLWSAVGVAWELLVDRLDARAPGRIVVLTDGPDTCAAGEGLRACDAPCATAPYGVEEIRARIAAAKEDDAAPRIGIDFIQFEAPGYRGRDPRQVAVACASGGHHLFVDQPSSGPSASVRLGDALREAARDLRAGFGGAWRVAVAAPDFTSDEATPPGRMYGLAGTLTVRPASGLVAEDRPAPFGVIQLPGTSATWDRRPAVIKPCGGPAACGASAEPSDGCTVVCSSETGLCPGGADGVSLPDAATCSDGDAPGICCGGTCGDPGVGCAACDAISTD